MRKLFIVLFGILPAVWFTACNYTGPPGGGTGVPAGEGQSAVEESPGGQENQDSQGGGARQVLRDRSFQKGFNLLGLNSAVDGATVYKKIRYGSVVGAPQWQLAQWRSKYDLKYGQESSTVGRYALKDQSKTFAVDLSAYDLTLGVDAEYEFASANLAAPASWPHLLIEQTADDGYWLGLARSVNAKVRFTIDKAEDKRGTNEGFHAQFAWFVYIVDKNTESPGYGNFLWFGLNIYDSTKEFAGRHASQDLAGGPGNFIYSVGAEEFMDGAIETGREYAVDFDILPRIKEALPLAQSRGFMTGSNFNDLRITGTNIGWEVFDRWNVAVTIHELGIGFAPSA
jgi:hypothetical protein